MESFFLNNNKDTNELRASVSKFGLKSNKFKEINLKN